jgi:alpha-ribazole phosphatase/probable phosphoglycerate mutase
VRADSVVYITYFVHGATTDNERGIASGWYDIKLSELGRKQSLELKALLKNRRFCAVYCSDLRRALHTAEIVFDDRVKIMQDKRLRECDYGDLTRAKSEKIDSLMLKHVDKPFPNGECYKDVERRIKSFLDGLHERHAGKSVALVAHRAPQLALDVLLKGKTWEQAIKEDWRLTHPSEWRPSWEYKFEA